MIDSKTLSSGATEFCNAIVMTASSQKWIDAFSDLYEKKGLHLKKIGENGGSQYIWSDDKEETHIVIHAYDKGKLMVQPGAGGESTLLAWIDDLSSLDITMTPQLGGQQVPALPGMIPVAMAGSLAESTECVDDPPNEPVEKLPSDSISKPCDQINVPELIVKLPPKSKKDKKKTVPSASSPKERPWIVNELLCYVQNKMDAGMPIDTVSRICSQFYTEESVFEAKELLFEAVKTAMRFRRYNGENKKEQHMGDIIKVLLEAELEDTPLFTAQTLSNLPALSVDCMDSLQLRTDIESIKQQLRMMQSNHNELTDLVKLKCQIDEEKELNQTTKQTAEQDKVSAIVDVPEENNISGSTSDPADDVPGDDCGRANNNDLGIELSNRFAPLAAAGEHNQGGHRRTHSRVFTNNNRAQWNSGPSYHDKSSAHADPHRGQMRSQGRGYRQPKQEDIVYGSGSSMHLKPAQDSSSAEGNRICSGIFVTKLDPRTTVRDIANAVELHTGYRVKPEKMPTKHSSYSSFYIRCERNVRHMLLDASIWPRKSWAKPFYN